MAVAQGGSQSGHSLAPLRARAGFCNIGATHRHLKLLTHPHEPRPACNAAAGATVGRAAGSGARNNGCYEGCPLAGAAVCGASGVTFANACLARCAGTAVAHDGPCRAFSPASSVRLTTDAPGGGHSQAHAHSALRDHPIAAFLHLEASAAAANASVAAAAGAAPASSAAKQGGPAHATATDMQRFAAEELVLVGAARLGRLEGGKPTQRAESRCGRECLGHFGMGGGRRCNRGLLRARFIARVQSAGSATLVPKLLAYVSPAGETPRPLPQASQVS
jgi:hypothetical protein